ncbi:MAG TPA: hypothetical protein VMS76_11050 [Planctomycetota bacterium]|nr:hypothetical protein [Planctomycetota bacterium]
MRAPLLLFAIIVVMQAVRTVVVYGNQTIAGIGLLGYLSPLGAAAAFYLLAREWRNARRWLAIYVTCAAVVAATVALHFFGFGSRLFDSIALDTVYGLGGRVKMYCGILRSSEFAAFHAATAACIALAWISGARRLKGLIPVGMLTGLLLLAVVLSGRRKMLAQLGLFLVIFLYLEARSRGRRGRVLAAVTFVGIVGGLIFMLSAQEGAIGGLEPYLARSGSLVGDSVERFTSMTVGSFAGVVANVGFFGAGAGIASQGSQYYGGGRSVIWSNAEGGLGRVLAELGIPGLLLLFLLAWAGSKALRRVARFAARSDSRDARLVLGLAAILPSNAAVFVTAHQLYGDPFVLVVLGALFGLAAGFPASLALSRCASPRPLREADAAVSEAAHTALAADDVRSAHFGARR